MIGMDEVLVSLTRGDCPPLNGLKEGDIPVVTTTEENNGIDGFYTVEKGTEIFEDMITIPANGSKYRAFYHPYKFAAVPDILVCKLKPEFASLEAKLYICSVINQSSWRFSYFRKCNEQKLGKDVQIALPVKNGVIDTAFIKKSLSQVPAFQSLKTILGE